MNIDDAVRVLNEHKHNNHEWRADRTEGRYVCVGTPPYAGEDTPFPVELPAFEAIAIAEKLERDGGRDMPATRKLMQVYRGFARDLADCFADGDVVTTSSAGHLTYGDIRAALHEWEPRS